MTVKQLLLKRALRGPVTEFIPASYLQYHNNVLFILDDTSASELTRKKAPWLIDDVQWDKRMIKKAVIHLSLILNKPILKLTNEDYYNNGLSDLLVLFGQAYDVNIEVFNLLQSNITGWPGGKPDSGPQVRPERSAPEKKRVLIFSPHPDDDIISMGGTFQRLVDQGHDVHVAYQTSGNIAVADDEAFKFVEFIRDHNSAFSISSSEASKIYNEIKEYLLNKKIGETDIESFRRIKGIIRMGEAKNTCRFIGIPEDHVHFLNLPFYETGKIEKNKISMQDYQIICDVIEVVRPHQIFAAGDLADPHGTHKVCLDGVLESLKLLKNKDFINDCWLWLYKGAWAEWDIDQIDMAVPLSPDEVVRKRYGIFKHQSQKDGVVFQGTDKREFWQRAEDRNSNTANIFNKLGFAEYAAMEAFVKCEF